MEENNQQTNPSDGQPQTESGSSIDHQELSLTTPADEPVSISSNSGASPMIDDNDGDEDDEQKSGAKEMEFRLNEDLIGDKKKHWYVINSYSGYEENVCQALKQRIDSMDMSHKIFDVVVPKEKKVEIKNGKKKIVEKKIFPGYVLVQMIVDEDSWYVVRNTPSVTGFIGFGSKPTPLSDEEIKNIQKRMGIEEPEFKIDLEEGESVKIIDGPFKDFDGVISEIDKIRGKIKVLVSMFGRETPVELDALQIKKL